MGEQHADDSRLLPYAPRLLSEWSPTDDERHMRVAGSLAFVDIAGFTRLTERLSRTGKAGAEEMSDILDATFTALLDEAMAEGADLVTWGGDAVLLLFQGTDHAVRAARASHRMRSSLRTVGRISTSTGVVVLRMSVGVHSGEFDFFLVGDPAVHRELLVTGAGVSTTVALEAAARAGQIGLSAETAALLPGRVLGSRLLDGRLLRLVPPPAAAWDEGTRRSRPPVSAPEILPPPVLAHLRAGAGDAEHRAVAVAFVRWSGTDARLLSEGPTAVASALDHLVRTVQHACGDHDVTFFETDVSHDGGKIMLVAGAPRSADHLEERLLRAARQILDAGCPLPMRIGINRGHVFAGDFGPPFRRTYSVKGDAINLAARLVERAEPGQALATIDALSHSQTEFVTEPLPPFAVKGKARAVHAAVVGALVGTRTEASVDVELTGRAADLATLTAALDDARDGRGRTVEVVGEPGLGKSRLVTELGRRSGVPTLRTGCDSYQSSTAYFPFRRLLRDALRLPDDQDAAAVRLREQVAELTPWLAAWTPLLGIPLDMTLPPTPETTELDPAFVVSRVEGLVVELLTAVLPETTTLVFEDVQDIDDASAALLRRLCAEAERRPWLLLLTRREVASAPDWLEEITSRTILRLAPLDEAASMALARQALADQALPRHTIQTLVRRSGGNPMFLVALLEAAQRSGDLSQLPDTVEALIASAIDRLPPTDRRALRYAAVIGADVDVRVLDVLMSQHGGLTGDQMGRLEEVLERGRRPGSLRFRNVLIRDVAYEGLPYRSRRVLHERVGSAIEENAEDPDALAETLSLHFFHAGNESKARRYAVTAGRRAVEKHAHGDAVDFFERAVRSVPADGSVSTDEHAAVLEQLADSRFVLGLTDETTTAYAAARRAVRDDPVREALLVAKEVRVDLRRRRLPQAMRRLSRALSRMEGLRGEQADAARSRLARRYAYSRYLQGRIDEALRWAETAAEYAEVSHDKAALAQAYEMLNGIHAGSGRPEPRPYGQLALQANRELGDLPRQGHCLNNLAVEAFTHGRWEEALTQYRQAAEIFRRTGDSASEVNAAYNQTELLVRQRRFDDAAELLPEVLLVARAVEDEELVALALREQAQVRAAGDDVAGSLALLDDARRRFVELDEDDEVVVTDLVRVEVLARAGHADDAERLLNELTRTHGSARQTGSSARWHRLSALVAEGHGDLPAARTALLAGLERAGAEDDLFEQALLLRELVAVSRLLEEPIDPDLVARARELQTSLGIVDHGFDRQDAELSSR